MTLDDYLNTVKKTAPDDWHKMQIQSVCGWEHGTANGGNYLAPKTFDTVAVLENDIDISLLMTATVVEDFAEPWATTNFSSPDASSVSVWFRYRGSVVFEWSGVFVDGSRYLLPLPKSDGQGNYTVPQADLPLARLLFGMYGPQGPYDTIEKALNRAKVAIV